MALYNVTPGKNAPDTFNVIIEIPMNADPVKYEVDKETGAIFVDRFMSTSMHYPTNYGYVPNTLAQDGDRPRDPLGAAWLDVSTGTFETTALRSADLPALLAELGAQGINELHVEAGPTLSGAFLEAGLVDELLVYQAPLLIGQGRPLAELMPLPGLDAARRWQWVEATSVGADLRLRLRPT